MNDSIRVRYEFISRFLASAREFYHFLRLGLLRLFCRFLFATEIKKNSLTIRVCVYFYCVHVQQIIAPI